MNSRAFLSFVYACLLQSVACLLEADEPAIPNWIAHADSSVQRYRLVQSVNLGESVLSGRMTLAADFARVTVMINDSTMLTVEPYCQLQRLDVTPWLKTGSNMIAIDVERVNGPSAIAVELELRLNSGGMVRLVSDETWATDGGKSKVRTLGAVRAELWGNGRRDASLSPVENYEQWQQAKSRESEKSQPKFWTAPGFQISLLRAAHAEEGSWISLAFDDKGRAIISREDEGLLRMTLDADRTSVEKVEAIPVNLKECRGLVFDSNDLYANANNSKGLYRAQIDGDVNTGSIEQLREFAGGVGHGRNDLTINDGWLYLIHGDSVELPRDDVTDLTSPVRHWGNDGRGEGQLLRMQLSTRKWEVVCAGLRNPYGVASHRGEMFTFDADNEYDMGTPWYRPTRLIALFPGGDVGYRTASKKLPPRFHDQPENAPPVLTIGRSSPTAVFCDPKLAFPAPYRDALFLLDWTYGRVLAVHLVQRGAGWRAQAELFLQGRPLNVTDVACGNDGAMYLITGGRKTQSSLYRVVATRKPIDTKDNLAEHDEVHEREAAAFSQKQIEIRRQLELIARNRDVDGLKQVFDHLADSDSVLRHAARIALERLPSAHWRNRVSNFSDVAKWLFGNLAIAQAMDSTQAAAMLERWLQCEPMSFDLSSRLVWIRLGEWCMRANRDTVQAKRSEVVAKLLTCWPETSIQHVANEVSSVELRHRLAQLLGALQSEEAIEIIVRDLLASTLQEDQIAGLLALRQQRSGWTESQRRLQFGLLQDVDHLVGGEGLPKFMISIREESLGTLSENERSKMASVLGAKTEVVADASAPRPFIQKWSIDELEDVTSDTIVEGDRELGARVFREALCARCHRVGREGQAVGPDLTFVGRRFSPRDLLESILTPSRSVAENFRTDAIVTQSGEVHIGRLMIEGDYRSQKVRIQTDPLKLNSVVEIDKNEIEEHKQLDRSLMPDGLLDTFSRHEIRALLAFLQNPI
jgi:putative heme-binding domain-containing protein